MDPNTPEAEKLREILEMLSTDVLSAYISTQAEAGLIPISETKNKTKPEKIELLIGSNLLDGLTTKQAYDTVWDVSFKRILKWIFPNQELTLVNSETKTFLVEELLKWKRNELQYLIWHSNAYNFPTNVYQQELIYIIVASGMLEEYTTHEQLEELKRKIRQIKLHYWKDHKSSGKWMSFTRRRKEEYKKDSTPRLLIPDIESTNKITPTQPEELPLKEETVNEPEEEVQKEATDHMEIQYLLLSLGSSMELDVWVARNDRNKVVNGKKFSEIPSLRDDLPRQFDNETNRIIESIDVLWLDGDAIMAAFEIESTTSIYSGLLRMSDLRAKQPNINIPLYIVAPDNRKDKVLREVNRPTFSKLLKPPLSRVCKFISFSGLRKWIETVDKKMIRYLPPEFIDDIAEPCER